MKEIKWDSKKSGQNLENGEIGNIAKLPKPKQV
jgi:hypothetical protein